MEEALRILRAALAALPDDGARVRAAEAAVSTIWHSWRAPNDRNILERALADAGGKVRVAAKLLGVSRRTLQYRMRKFGVVAPLKGAPPKLTAGAAGGTVAE
jgi:transcriptional regulator of acetoin/glycerol metabolism